MVRRWLLTARTRHVSSGPPSRFQRLGGPQKRWVSDERRDDRSQRLTKRYGDFVAIDKVSIEVKRGEVLGFLGPNGAGKTTTMKILTCFTAPTEGSARVNGHDVFDEPLAVREAIGYLPESTPLYTDMLVLEYLEFAAEMRGLEGRQARKRDQAVVERDRPRRRDRQGDPRALQGLPPARRSGPGAGARAADPDPRRADERPRPEPGGRDPRPDQGHRPRAHRHALDAQPAPRCRSPATAC